MRLDLGKLLDFGVSGFRLYLNLREIDLRLEFKGRVMKRKIVDT